MAGLNTRYKFGLAVAINSASGMNCSDVQAQGNAANGAACEVHNAVVGLPVRTTSKLENFEYYTVTKTTHFTLLYTNYIITLFL